MVLGQKPVFCILNLITVEVKVTAVVHSFSVYLDNIFLTAEPFVTRLGVVIMGMSQSVMQKDSFAVFKVKVTERAHVIRCVCFYHINWTADPLATKFNWMIHHPKLLRKDLIAMVKVKDTVKVQNFVDCLSVLSFLCHIYFCNHTRCVDVLILRDSIKHTVVLHWL